MIHPPYTDYPRLIDGDLERHVRAHNRMVRKALPLEPLIAKMKTTRAIVDALLLIEGFQSNQGVTCVGYDVLHHHRKGQTSVNMETLIELLVKDGVDRACILRAILAATETGQPSNFSSIEASKGAHVRAA